MTSHDNSQDKEHGVTTSALHLALFLREEEKC